MIAHGRGAAIGHSGSLWGLLLAAACFMAGLAAGVVVGPRVAPPAVTGPVALSGSQPAQVLRVIDGMNTQSDAIAS